MQRVKLSRFSPAEKVYFAWGFLQSLPTAEHHAAERRAALAFAYPWKWAGCIPACGAQDAETLGRHWAALVMSQLARERRWRNSRQAARAA